MTEKANDRELYENVSSSNSTLVVKTLGVKETMKIFNSLSPTSCAKMVTIAVENETKIVRELVLSPKHKSLIEQHEAIDTLTKNCPQRAQELKEISAKKYIVEDRKNKDNPARKIVFAIDMPTTSLVNNKRTSITQQESNNNDTILAVDVNKKKKRKMSIKWKDNEGKHFQNITKCSDYIRESFPTLRVRSTFERKESKTTLYQCYENSNIANSVRGNCYARMIKSVMENVNKEVKFQVNMDSTCVCRNISHIKTAQGLPATLKDEVCSLIGNIRGIQPQEIKKKIMTSIIEGDLDEHKSVEITKMETCKISRSKVALQIYNHTQSERRKGKKNGTLPQYMNYVMDLVNLRKQHTFLPPTTLPPVIYDTEKQLQRYGELLYKLRSLVVINTLGIKKEATNAFRMMTFMDPKRDINDINTTDPEIKLYDAIDRWQMESRATEDKEGNSYDTTSCFSSLALLWNIKECETLDFNVCCSADGTDKTTATNYQLLSFGTYNRDRHGKQSYRPFFYVLGPGERKLVFGIGMVSFLKYCRLLFGIKNIRFKGPCISDHCPVFVSVYEIAFPTSTISNCWIHILRKFTTGKGNGSYMKKTRDKTFLRLTAVNDVRQLHNCLTHEQFVTMGKLVIQGWEDKGEKSLAKTFGESYLYNPRFDRWTVKTTNEYGFDSSQNPMERSNSEVKGSRAFTGALVPGKDIGTMLMSEFPSMILQFSISKCGVDNYTKLLSENIIFQSQSRIYKYLMRYYSLFEVEVDYKLLKPDLGDAVTFIVNTEEFLGLPVSEERYCDYELGLLGKTSLNFKERKLYCDTVSSLCKIHGRLSPDSLSIGTDSDMIYNGSCADYCRDTYCHHSAIFQYAKRLNSHGKQVPRNRQRDTVKYRDSTSPHPMVVLKSKYIQIAKTIDDIRSMIMRYTTKTINKSQNAMIVVNKLAEIPNILERWNTIKTKINSNKILKLTQTSNRCILAMIDVKYYLDKLEEYKLISHEDCIIKLITLLPQLLVEINLL